MKKFTILLALLLTLSANKCSDKGGDLGALLDTKWSFNSLNGAALDLPDGVERPWLQLKGDQLTGFGGCNRLMGGYSLEGSKLNFSDLGSTKMYCENVQATEDAIKTALGKVDGYGLEGEMLKLTSGGKELAKLVKAKEVAE